MGAGRVGAPCMPLRHPPTSDPPTHPPFLPHPPTLQCRFADLERSLGESERARAVYELAIAQPVLDMPEVLWKVRWGGAGQAVSCSGSARMLRAEGLRHSHAVPLCLDSACAWRAHSAWRWSSCTGLLAVSTESPQGLLPHSPQSSLARDCGGLRLLACVHADSSDLLPHAPQAYIDFEIGEGNREGARELYERLLQRTRHVKVGRRRGCLLFEAGLRAVGSNSVWLCTSQPAESLPERLLWCALHASSPTASTVHARYPSDPYQQAPNPTSVHVSSASAGLAVIRQV